MRKIFILISVLLFLTLSVFADCLPSSADKRFHHGIGVVLLKNNGCIKIFELDNEKSKLSAYIKISPNGTVVRKRGVPNASIDDTFLAFKRNGEIALLTVESDTDDWYYVCYDRKRKLFGWIKKSDNIDFMSWHDFLNFFGRKNGIVVFRNVSPDYKKLFSNPNSNSSLVDDFYFAKHINLWLIEGDWMLVKVTTYDGQTKTGWLRWRLKDGTIIAFPDFE